MKKLFALLAAIGAVLFFWKKKHPHEEASAWGTDTSSSWGESAATEEAAETDVVSDASGDATS
jgi:hypothetical protein